MFHISISIVDISTLLKNIDININIDMVIFENIDIDIDKGILQNINIDKISYRLEFGISNRARCFPKKHQNLATRSPLRCMDVSFFLEPDYQWGTGSQLGSLINEDSPSTEKIKSKHLVFLKRWSLRYKPVWPLSQCDLG